MRHLNHIRETIKASSFMQKLIRLGTKLEAFLAGNHPDLKVRAKNDASAIDGTTNSLQQLVQHEAKRGAENIDPHGRSRPTATGTRRPGSIPPKEQPCLGSASDPITRIIKTGGGDGDDISQARAKHDLKILAGSKATDTPHGNLIHAAHLRPTDDSGRHDLAGPALALDPLGSTELIAS